MFEYSFIQSSRNIQFIICIEKTHNDSVVDKNCMLHCFRLQDFIIFQGFHIFRLQMTKIKLNQKKFPDIKKK